MIYLQFSQILELITNNGCCFTTDSQCDTLKTSEDTKKKYYFTTTDKNIVKTAFSFEWTLMSISSTKGKVFKTYQNWGFWLVLVSSNFALIRCGYFFKVQPWSKSKKRNIRKFDFFFTCVVLLFSAHWNRFRVFATGSFSQNYNRFVCDTKLWSF